VTPAGASPEPAALAALILGAAAIAFAAIVMQISDAGSSARRFRRVSQ
jgi:hypothetical protein